MDRDEVDKTGVVGTSDDIDSRCAVNSLILDYYKKFGRKRDLEQFFLLSTAQSEIKDKSSLFWRKMKSENDSSDSGGRKSNSPHEVCRISIRCSLPEVSSSQDEEPKTKNDSPQTSPQTVSPPIIIEEMPVDISRQTDEESFNLDDNNSQKSLDAILDSSAHKPLSPTSSITSQRKLEWDSLADVGYANESDRKTSASSLSTLERLALKQQYSNNDSKQDIGLPTSHSTPLDENEGKSKGKKGLGKKTTKIYKKDVEFVEVNVPHTSDFNPAPSINVNLTKHISFNVEKDGEITVENVKRDLNISPEKVSVETEPFPYLAMDKEIQTSLTKEKPSSKEKSSSMDETPKTDQTYNQKIPVMISLNTLRKRLRRKKTRVVRKKSRTKMKIETKEVTPQERSGEQLSEAESFEYMPGHMYNQNQMKDSEPIPDNSNGNKSSLESSGPPTTDSSKDSKHSLTKDLEKCVDLLKVTLQKRYDDGNTKKKLIKEIVQRLVNSRYRSDDTTTEFLSGLSYNSKMLGIQGNNTTTSTSDANYTDDSKHKKPKKSILRSDKFNSNPVASTSQSAPNLYSASYDKTNTHLMKKLPSNTESDASSKGKTSSDNGFPKTSSEELYLKYLEALRREEAYKKHLKEKEMFLKQKLASSETVMKAPIRQDSKINSRLKDLMKDLTRNNYDDGSGDASKLEGGSSSNIGFERIGSQRNQRSHSVFTLSSSLSDKRPNLKKNMQAERESAEAGPSKHHYCCCPHHYMRSKVTDSSIQVNIKHQHEGTTSNENDKLSQTKPKTILPCGCKKSKLASPRNTCIIPDEVTGEIKYMCLCNGKQDGRSDPGENIRIYKCSRLTDQGVQMENRSRIYNAGSQCENICSPEIYRKDDNIELIQAPCRMNPGTESNCSSYDSSNARRYSKSSQTNVMRVCYENDYSSGAAPKNLCGKSTRCIVALANVDKVATVYEGTRCLQTEISINPKISDPTLSDIVIINDCDCAKLISEQIRRVPIKFTEKSNSGTKTYSDVSTSSNMSDKLLIPSEDNIFKEESKTSKANVNEMEQEQEKLSAIVAAQQQYIPQHVDLTRRNNMVDQGISTEKILNTDETTSISDACGKFEQRASSPSENNKKVSIKTSVTKIITENDPKCNTYPKKDIVKEKTPFKRANTNTGTLACCVQTDTVKQKDRDAYYNQNKCGKQNTTPETRENESQVEKSECGSCSQQTHEECRTENKSLRKRPSLQNDKKDIGIQKDLCDEESKKCTYEKTEITRIITKNDPKCNTYPKKETIKEKAPFKRTNTDIDKLVCSCVQTDKVKQKDIDTNYNQNKCGNQNTTPETCENESQAEKSGCCNSSKKTNEECRKDTDTLRKKPTVQKDKKDTGIQFESCDENSKKCTFEKTETTNIITKCEITNRTPDFSNVECQTEVPDECKKINDSKKSSDCELIDAPNIGRMESCCKNSLQDFCKDPVIDMIRDITRRYTKKDKINFKNKKCFTEIMTVLNYLLETEESTDPEQKTCCSISTDTKSSSNKYKSPKTSKGDCCTDKQVNKNIQLPSLRKPNKDIKITDSSDPTCSSELPSTSTESAACKVLNKIKKECEKYHKKKCSKGMKCEITSSSTNCEKCKKVHHCACRNHKCKRSKVFEKLKKKCIAYNLIIQTSESVLSEETVCEKKCRPLQNIIVKVPKRQGKDTGKKETKSRTQQRSPCSPRCGRKRSKSCPDDSETSDECARRMEMASVREYLEQNRPDFVEKTSQRQNCLKFISERRTQDQHSPRLKMVVVHKPRCIGNVAASPVFCRGIYYRRCDSVEPCIPYESAEPRSPCRSYEPVDPCMPCRPPDCVTFEPSAPCRPYNSDPCSAFVDTCNSCNDRLEQTNVLPNGTCCHCTWNNSPT